MSHASDVPHCTIGVNIVQESLPMVQYELILYTSLSIYFFSPRNLVALGEIEYETQ